MANILEIAAVASFGIAALEYGIVGALIFSAHTGTRQANWLLAAVIAAGLWSATSLYLTLMAGAPAAWVPLVDAVFLAVWVSCFAAMIGPGAGSGTGGLRLPRVLGGLAWLGAGLVVTLETLAYASGSAGGGRSIVNVALLAIALLGLLIVEQLYRNSQIGQRRVWLPIAVAVGAVFSINVFVYSQGVLFRDVLLVSWLMRGLVVAFAAPVMVIAIKRQSEWETKLFVSRHVVFYTATLTVAGIYLIAMAAVAYLIGTSERQWGPAAQSLFLASALLVLVLIMFSADLRGRLRVFIAKHFYRNKYDYREEWLRLIKTLVGSADRLSADERGIRVLASIVGSRGGELWLHDESTGSYVSSAGWRCDRPTRDLTADDPVIAFLERSRWVIDTVEAEQDPEKYGNAFVDDPAAPVAPSIFVPLVLDDRLIGVVRLERPARLEALDYEDHDLLKTAGQQVAIFIRQEHAKEELSEAKQFEAFSRLTTFLMHDLKNLIAQQQLIVTNAKKFGDRPEFVEDAFRTIDASVQRMRGVLARLQADVGSRHVSQVSLARLLKEVCAACADRRPAPRLQLPEQEIVVAMDRERLAAALTHAIRNAQDATADDGTISLELAASAGNVTIAVTDDGAGMDAEFVERRLFRPFDSTKGAQGMGIGAYQIRETFRSAGGDVRVASEPGRGTRFEMRLPVAALQSDPDALSDPAVPAGL